MFIKTAQSDDYFVLWVYSESLEENQELKKIKEFVSGEYDTAAYLFPSPYLAKVLTFFQTEQELAQVSAEIALKFF